MTALSEIPSIPDNSIVAVLSGKLAKIDEIKTLPGKPKEDGTPTTFQAQNYMIEAPSGRLWLSTTRKSHFIGQEMLGVAVKFVSTAGNDGLRGLRKMSYQGRDATGNPITRHRVNVEDGAVISKVEIQPPPKPQAPTDPVLSIAREMRYCWDTIKKVAPAEFTLEMTKDWSTSLFIECQRKGIKFPIAAPSPSVPEQKEPDSPPQGKPEATPAAAPAPTTPKLTKEQLGTKIIGEVKITPAMLKDHDLEKVFDLCYAEARHEVPVEFLDAAFDAAKKRHKEEAKLYQAILMNWKLFVGDAKKLQQAAADEKAALEEPAVEM